MVSRGAAAEEGAVGVDALGPGWVARIGAEKALVGVGWAGGGREGVVCTDEANPDAGEDVHGEERARCEQGDADLRDEEGAQDEHANFGGGA